MWEHDSEGLLAVLLEFYSEAEDNLGRVMDIAYEVEVSCGPLLKDRLWLINRSYLI